VHNKVEQLGLRKLGLLATGSTVKFRLYHDYFEKHGVQVVEPTPAAQKVVDEIIGEVTRGLIDTRATVKLLPIINQLVGKGAEGIVLGCTELPLVLGSVKLRIPMIDSAREHARHAVRKIIYDNS
jgi:aspartate racemase